MSELQHQADISNAKAKLLEVEKTKEARKDPRASESTGSSAVPARTAADDRGKQIRPVKAKPKKKGFGRKLKEAMFSEDIGNGSVTEYVFFKIMIPSIKRILSDMANTAINMALGLDPKTRTIQAGNTHTANASVYRDRNYNRREESYGSSYRAAISELEWDEETANDILNQIGDLIERYGNCSLEDVYSIMDRPSLIRMTDRKWGWTSMRGIDKVPVDPQGERWYIDMPPARPIN